MKKYALIGSGFILLSVFSCRQHVIPEDLTTLGDELKDSFSTDDSLFSKPFVDMDEWREEPVFHRYVHGGFEGTQTRLSTETTHQFDRPGNYFPAVRVTSQREGNAQTPFSRIRNLDRVRVVVR